MRDYWGLDAEHLSHDLEWTLEQAFAHNYRDHDVIECLKQIAGRAALLEGAPTGESETWRLVRQSSSSLADAMEIYRDRHPEGAPFPFQREFGDYIVLARRGMNALDQAEPG
jgi:hypothetical protein